jgi:hypothetical protein
VKFWKGHHEKISTFTINLSCDNSISPVNVRVHHQRPPVAALDLCGSIFGQFMSVYTINTALNIYS